MDKIPPHSLASNYLRTRSIIDLEFAMHAGVEWTRHSVEIRERLGLPLHDEPGGWTGGKGLEPGERRRPRKREIKELLSFPLFGGGYYCKCFPVPEGDKSKSHRLTKGVKQPIVIPKETWAARRDSRETIFLTEGAWKALAILHAGGLPIGLNGTYASEMTRQGKRRLRQLRGDLRERFEWFGRKVFLSFDADQRGKAGVRRSIIRSAIFLFVLGADVRQLTTWNLDEGKGVDDFLAGRVAENSTSAREVLGKLIEQAPEFFSTLEPRDLNLVAKELRLIKMEEVWHSRLTRRFAKVFDVRAGAFDKYRQNEKSPQKEPERQPEWRIDPQPWPGEVQPLEELLDAIEAEYLAFFDMSIEQADACVLWAATTYFMDVWQIHPYLGITAAVKNSGKTSLLIFISLFSYRPWVGASITASTVYRVVDECRPSLFVDEIADTFKDKSDVKTVFKAAYTRASARIPRTEKVREQWVVRHYYAFCAKAFDLTGKISAYDDSIGDRSIEIHMLKERIEHRNFWE